MTKIIPRSFGTHDGTFHADEVTACALLLLFDLIDAKLIVRTRDPTKLVHCEYVCDVAGEYNPAKKRFDHHQLSYDGELSSAGMVWKDLLRREFIDEATYLFFNRSLILGIDAHDTGRTTPQEGVCTFSQVVSNFVPPVYDASDEVIEGAFFEALEFVLGHLKRLKERFHYIQLYREKVAQAMALKQSYLLFDEALPWIDSFFDLGGEEHPALFVIMPSQAHWKVRTIPPKSEDRMKMRQPLPKEWAGLRDEELQRVSGIGGAIFCHKGRFISVWETKEDALKALNYVLSGISS